MIGKQSSDPCKHYTIFRTSHPAFCCLTVKHGPSQSFLFLRVMSRLLPFPLCLGGRITPIHEPSQRADEWIIQTHADGAWQGLWSPAWRMNSLVNTAAVFTGDGCHGTYLWTGIENGPADSSRGTHQTRFGPVLKDFTRTAF